MENEQITQSKNVIDFFALVSEFCIYTNEVGNYSLNHILNFYQRILPMIYIKATFLPELNQEDVFAQTFMSDENFEEIMNEIRKKTNDVDFYYALENTLENEPGMVYSFAYDVALIYRYSKDFLNLFQQNLTTSKLSAIEYAKSTFISNWGKVLLRLQRNIHDNLYRTNLN
ncbi:MAG: hypothetical protein A2X12_06205 [Bacteroidetes bacterium GWE2_29_8]|nr:MAG: hypothetical protein A2X12_06205 [Bacteroidetes bacterium GWE2_29_8]OFY17182.1 MAG: hypothetical protein A2X02_02825 [Bacteroidetes bacterium GWF2_29_10]